MAKEDNEKRAKKNYRAMLTKGAKKVRGQGNPRRARVISSGSNTLKDDLTKRRLTSEEYKKMLLDSIRQFRDQNTPKEVKNSINTGQSKSELESEMLRRMRKSFDKYQDIFKSNGDQGFLF